MKIAIIIAFRNFRDEEYFIPKEVFERAGAEVTTFSTAVGTAVGVQGGEVEVERTLDELNIVDFDAVVFAGGVGAKTLFEDEDIHRICQETVRADKILAAICIAPVILAKSGVLFGKKATVWSSPMDKTAVNILKEEGTLYRDQPVVADGKIVTANGPAAARAFAERVLELLT